MDLVTPYPSKPPSVFITPFSYESIALMQTASSQIASPISAVYATANSAFYFPFQISTSVIVNRFFWCNGTTASTDTPQVGVYNHAGAAITLGTATLASGVSQPQFDNVADFRLAPGKYYMALWCNGVTTHILRSSPAVRFQRAMGCFQQTSQTSGLPASITFTALTTGYIPLFGLALRASP